MTEDAEHDRADERDADRPADAASPAKVHRLARRYEAEGRPFARVTVVRREPPVSANVGDRALVTPDGDIVGWIGGASCAQSIVAREATAALERGEPTLLGLAPDPETVDRPGVEAFPMTCASGGSLELFVEPVLPTPRLVVVGDSPAALTLARLATQLTYDVTAVGADPGELPDVDRVVPESGPEAVGDVVEGADYAVVASMGAFDEAGLAAALGEDVPYVGLVASDPRADELFERVADRLDREPGTVADAVTTPAGLDVGARTAEEVAVSVLAELVDVRGTAARSLTAVQGGEEPGETVSEEAEADGDEPATAVDPVCGMTVEVGTAVATAEFEGETYHFCGEGCAEAFSEEPERYRDAIEGEP